MGQCTLSKFAGDAILGGVADTSESHAAFQRDGGPAGWRNGLTRTSWVSQGDMSSPGRVEQWPRYPERWGTEQMKSRFAEEDLGVLVDNTANLEPAATSWQRRQTASWAALERALPAGRGRWSFPSAQHWDTANDGGEMDILDWVYKGPWPRDWSMSHRTRGCKRWIVQPGEGSVRYH